MTEVVYAQGGDGTHRWAFRGPAILVRPADAQRVWAEALRAGLQTLMSNVKRDAQAAYADVQPAHASFAYVTQVSPFPRGQLIARGTHFNLIEYPTRPHVISAKNAPYLWFRWGPSGSAWARVKSVNHPGTRGRNAIAPILDRYAPQWLAICDRAVGMMLAT